LRQGLPITVQAGDCGGPRPLSSPS
jgi:hypothetical protein